MKRTTVSLQTLTINADMFIVPNKPININEILKFNDNIIDYLASIDNMNKGLLSIDNYYNEQMVEVWLTSKIDAASDNLGNHGINYVDIYGNEVHADAYFLDKLPLSLLKDKVEGDQFELNVFLNSRHCWDFRNADVLLKINITCNQKGYRYGNYGKFEEVISKITK